MVRSTTSFVVILFGLLTVGVGACCLILDIGADQTPWVILTVVGSLLALVGVVLWSWGRTSSSANSKPGQGQFNTYELKSSESRALDGRRYETYYRPPKAGKHGHSATLIVTVRVDAPDTLQFNRENWFDRMCKAVGIAREHETGDVAFDERLYVRGPSAAFAEKYLADAEKRASLIALFDMGYDVVRISGTDIAVEWPHFDPAVHDRPTLPEDTARHLFALADRIPVLDTDVEEWRVDWHTPLWCFVICFALMFAFVFIFPAVRTSDLFPMGTSVYVGVWLLFAWVSALLLHGESTSHDRWVKLMAAGLIMLALGSVGTVAAINALADRGGLLERELVVTSKHIRHGKKNSKTYVVSVNAWDREGEMLEFTVGSSEYDRIVPGQTELRVRTGQGSLGILWLKSKEVGS